MAYSYTIADRISFGNKRLLIYNVTDVSASGSDLFPGCDTVHGVKAVDNSRATDTFVEAVGAPSASTTRNKITLTAPTALDDGHVWMWVN